MKTGVECEYFLLSPDGKALADARDTQEKPCYDQSALMRRYPVITEICDAMLQLGWGAYQNDHEDANGQFEMNWAYNDADPPTATSSSSTWSRPWPRSTGCARPSCPSPSATSGNGSGRPRLGLGRERREEPVPRRGRRARPLQARLQLLGRRDERRRRAVRRLQPDREQLPADQRPSDPLRRHLVAQRSTTAATTAPT